MFRSIKITINNLQMHNNVRARSLGYFTQVGITVTTATVVAAMAMATAVTNNELKVKRIKRNKRPNGERNAQRSSARNSVNLNRIKLSYKSRVYFFFVSTSFATFDSPCHTLSLSLSCSTVLYTTLLVQRSRCAALFSSILRLHFFARFLLLSFSSVHLEMQ